MTGDITADQAFNLSEKYFGKVNSSGGSRPNQEKPLFTPSVVSIRDDEIVNKISILEIF